MKKRFICIIIAIFSFSLFSLAAYALSKNFPSSKNELFAFSPSAFILAPATLEDAAFQNLIAQADSVLKQNKNISIQLNPYLRHYIACNDQDFSGAISATKTTATLRTSSNVQHTDTQKYLILLAYITQQYADCIISIDYNYDPTYNRMPFPTLFVCPSFRSSGYSSITAYYEDIRSGVIPMPTDAYKIDYNRAKIVNCSTDQQVDLFADVSSPK